MMQTDRLPGCCCAIVVYDLDEEYARQHSTCMSIPTKEQIKAGLEGQIKIYTGLYTLMVLTTNSNQKLVAEVLRELAFKECDEAPSGNHPELTVTLWSKALPRIK